MRYRIVEGRYGLLAEAQRYALPGTFPRRYWLVEFSEDQPRPRRRIKVVYRDGQFRAYERKGA